jgi:hypothetical protein
MFENRPEPVLTGFGPVQGKFGKFWTGYGSGSPQKGKKTGPDRTSKRYLESNPLYLLPITHNLMELLNESIKKSRHTCPYTAHHMQRNGQRPCIPWNSLTIIEGMQTDLNPRLN